MEIGSAGRLEKKMVAKEWLIQYAVSIKVQSSAREKDPGVWH